MADDVEGLMKSLQLQKPVLIGHSMLVVTFRILGRSVFGSSPYGCAADLVYAHGIGVPKLP